MSRRRSIALVGMPGSGKSTLGRLLCAKLNMSFADSDGLAIARCGQTIPQMFSTPQKIAHFRMVERRVLTDLATAVTARVIAVGGGGFCDEAARASLLEHCTCIWINCSKEVLLKRLARPRDIRPMLEGSNKPQAIGRLMATRSRDYAQAHHQVKITREGSPYKIVKSIIKDYGIKKLARADLQAPSVVASPPTSQPPPTSQLPPTKPPKTEGSLSEEKPQ